LKLFEEREACCADQEERWDLANRKVDPEELATLVERKLDRNETTAVPESMMDDDTLSPLLNHKADRHELLASDVKKADQSAQNELRRALEQMSQKSREHRLAFWFRKNVWGCSWNEPGNVFPSR
jgi:hypothetical protein